jgi:hypothetical protein
MRKTIFFIVFCLVNLFLFSKTHTQTMDELLNKNILQDPNAIECVKTFFDTMNTIDNEIKKINNEINSYVWGNIGWNLHDSLLGFSVSTVSALDVINSDAKKYTQLSIGCSIGVSSLVRSILEKPLKDKISNKILMMGSLMSLFREYQDKYEVIRNDLYPINSNITIDQNSIATTRTAQQKKSIAMLSICSYSEELLLKYWKIRQNYFFSDKSSVK